MHLAPTSLLFHALGAFADLRDPAIPRILNGVSRTNTFLTRANNPGMGLRTIQPASVVWVSVVSLIAPAVGLAHHARRR